MTNIKLTSYSSGAGWACKINPKDLGEILKKLSATSLVYDKNIVGFNSSDDCSIYPLDEKFYLIQSVDFFTPIVDDPYDFGRIAASNAFSDIYAMGGKPIFALNITCFPTEELSIDILHEILRGGQEIANQANTPILGGHSIKDKEPKYGMVVTGLVEKNKLVSNNTLKLDDNLILTKPIGTGIISTAIKKDLASKNDIKNIIDIMTYSNVGGANAMNKIKVSSCTDITGYGLLGHLKEMCSSSHLSASIESTKIPLIENTHKFANDGIIPGGTHNNYKFIENDVKFDKNVSEEFKFILSDAQTSGGLLIAVSEQNTGKLIDELKTQKCLTYSKIGKITKQSKKLIEIF